MNQIPSVEIPTQLREMAERNIEQTRAAYNQFLNMARQAQDLVSRSQGDVMRNALDVQAKAMRYAEANIDAGFKFAADLAHARDLKEYADIQARYAQAQTQSFTQQAQELGRMVADVAQKLQPGKI